MPHTENVEGFIEKLGNFYELVDDDDDTVTRSPIATVIRNASPKRHLSGPKENGKVRSNSLANGSNGNADGERLTSNGCAAPSDSDSSSSTPISSSPVSETSLGMITVIHIVLNITLLPRGAFSVVVFVNGSCSLACSITLLLIVLNLKDANGKGISRNV